MLRLPPRPYNLRRRPTTGVVDTGPVPTSLPAREAPAGDRPASGTLRGDSEAPLSTNEREAGPGRDRVDGTSGGAEGSRDFSAGIVDTDRGLDKNGSIFGTTRSDYEAKTPDWIEYSVRASSA
ncbi:hypothetical protein CC1G_13540 [Coprinopsis cinerea okayama7|uniref:Uncharacterized protein n=1 Tax=Coprinopsis cinerea (strain Okayama-7 / 130 / ATCC MYA-4618 / FGSC 9003) TaxID=240176 RepID=A8PIS1_COPC7|nr:hypothetical protein CC1G_13540 [Coprinopsis cinerea okayama7\|eukprot:XP_001841611.2 hypothetical protein CC1G_13540 [Coprinopsis cinerea okayama7\